MTFKTMPDPLRSDMLDEMGKPDNASGIQHGFFTRSGGVSEGLYRGLNVGIGSSDNRSAVLTNRARVAETMGVSPGQLITVHQCHSADAVSITKPFDGPAPQADALVTATPGLAIGVLTADCGPVLFADTKAGVIGAAHAGWKGAWSGILESTIEAMEALGSTRSNIVAVLGPSISQENYEVGPEFFARFTDGAAENRSYFSPSVTQNHYMFDLNRYTVDRLARAGVKAGMLGRCTYGEEDLFYSYRRSTHRSESDYGRQISAIVLEKH